MQKTTGAGVTRCSQGLTTGRWSIAAQEYQTIALEESSFAFEFVCEPNQGFPQHAHSDQDKFLLVQFGQLLVTLNDKPIEVLAGDLIRISRGVLCTYENRSSGTVKALCWVSPTLRLPEFFADIDGITDIAVMARISNRYGITLAPTCSAARELIEPGV